MSLTETTQRLLRATMMPLCGLGVFGCGQASPDSTMATDDEAVWLPGGETTNTLLAGSNAYTRHADNITDEHEPLFFAGNSLFNQAWVQAPASTESRDGVGPLFNARSCAACHFKDGRGRPPLEPGESFLGILLRLSVAGETSDEPGAPHPAYGGQLQPFSISGVAPEGSPRIETTTIEGFYDDGERYELLRPTYIIDEPSYGEFGDEVQISPRVAPAVIGLGLLQAIPVSRLEALEDPDDEDGDGISGRVHWVPDVLSGGLSVGRFGWKAEQPTVKQQSAGAFLGDMGITSTLFPIQDCTELETDCEAAISGGDPEIPDDLLDAVDVYARLTAVPARDEWDSPDVKDGEELFGAIGCASCHVPRHETTKSADLEELEGQIIYPYTDLLLHDMGEGLSDHRPSIDAKGNEWRTPPLWGLRFVETVNGHNRLLHDGRARGTAEAVLWHDGEARDAKEAFVALSKKERALLIRFVESL